MKVETMSAGLLPCMVLGALTPGLSLYAQSPSAQNPAPQQPVQIQVPPLQRRDPGLITLQANSRTVLVDVVVTDGKGHAVHGLKPSDFHLLEDGQPQTVASLEEHHPPTAAEIANRPKPPVLPPNTWTNLRPPADDAAATVFLLDALDSSPQAQMYARSQLLSYIDSLSSGTGTATTQVAIFQLDTQLHLIQGFTNDPATLKMALKNRYKPLMTAIPRGGGYTTQAFQMDFLTQAMQDLGAYLQTRPGRKNLVWFTAHIPRTAYDGGSAVGGSLHDAETFVFDYTKATDSLVLGEVSIYPIDTRGLEGNPAFSAANSRMPSPSAMGNFGTRQFFQHTDLDALAEATGGKAFYNTNGIKQAVAEVIDTGSNYYTLSFYPTNKNWDGSYRKLKVELAPSQPHGLQLEYRQGYYAQPEASGNSRAISSDAANPPPVSLLADEAADDGSGRIQLTHAASPDQVAFYDHMQLAATDPGQIIFEAHVSADPAARKLSKDELASPKIDINPKYRDRAFRTVKVFYRLKGTQLQLTPTATGTHHGEVEFVTLVRDDQGALVASTNSTVSMDLTPATYAKVMSDGVEMLSQVEVPEKGSYFLRIGVHDKASGKAGTIEVSTGDVKVGIP